MKKLILFVLSILLFSLVLTACGKEEKEGTPDNDIQMDEADKSDLSEVGTAESKKKYVVSETAITDRYAITFVDCIVADEHFQTPGWCAYAVFEIENITDADQRIEEKFDGPVFIDGAEKSDFEFYADNVRCDWTGSFDRHYGYAALIYDPSGIITISPHRAIQGYMDTLIPIDTQILEIDFDGMTFSHPVELRQE